MKKTTKVTKALTPAKKSTKAVRPTPSVPAAPVVPTAVVTTISANVDVGFGNSLFIRGEGSGLSWDKGLRMDCVADDRWLITLGESARPFTFKFLVNDEVWCAGTDYTLEPGATATYMPCF